MIQNTGACAGRVLFFSNGALFATWASRIPAVQAERGLGNGTLGLALLAIALGAVIAMPLAGRWIARLGSARVCKISALFYFSLLPIVTLVPGLTCFFPALFCFGASHATLDVAMNARAVEVEKQHRKPIMSSFHALWSTGGLTGAALGGLLAAQHLNPLIHFSVAAVFFGTIALLTFPCLSNAEEKSVKGLPAKTRSLMFLWSDRRILALGMVALCVMVGEGAMADWSAVYLHSNLGAREGLAAAGYATFSIAMAVGRFSGDCLAARFGPVKLVRVGGLLAASGLFLALVCGQTSVALAGFACVGIGFATVVPMVFSAAGSLPGISPGTALASVTTTGYLGFLIGPPFIGFSAELIGLRSALVIIVATSLLAAALATNVARGKTD